MDLTNYREDIKELCAREGTSQRQVGLKMGVRAQMVSKYSRKAGITQRYVDLCEALGYDVKVVYVKRGEAAE